MPTPDTLHGIVIVLSIGLLAGFGWSVAAWAFSLLSLTGRVVALVALLLALAALVFGKV